MNNVERIFSESADCADFSRRYVEYVGQVLAKLDANAIAAFVDELEIARENGRTVFIAGNGGSAATASHMANDLGVDVLKKSGCGVPFKAMALTDNVAVMTAIANDDGYHNMFVNQLRIHYGQGDLLIAISASGNSPNVVEAAEWVKKQGGKVLSMVGFDGGKLKELSDVAILAETPGGEYGPVEDAHMVLDHLIANWLCQKLCRAR